MVLQAFQLIGKISSLPAIAGRRRDARIAPGETGVLLTGLVN